MQNSDLKNVLISAIETADNRLLSMLYAVIKTYQITDNKTAKPVQATATEAPTATQTERKYKDDRPRRVVRIYRKPQDRKEPEVAVETSTPAPRVVRAATAERRVVQPTVVTKSTESAVSGRSNNGGFISDLMTKTVSKNALPA